MKKLKKYSIFLLVIFIAIILFVFKNKFQVDYTELSVNKIEEKIKNKESFILTFTNVSASNEQTYASEMIYMVDGVNQDVIKMNKLNKDYVSKNRTPIYYNTDIYSKTDDIKKIFNDLFNDLFKDVKLSDINFDNIPVTIWIQEGKTFYAGIGQIDKDNHELLTNATFKNDKIDTSKINFKITKSSNTEDKDSTDKTNEKDNTNDSNKTESKK